MLNIKNIINGWANLVKDQFDTLEPSIKEQAQLRFLNCERCHIRNGNVCSSGRKGINLNSGKLTKGCGCFLPAKIMAKKANCPLGKW